MKIRHNSDNLNCVKIRHNSENSKFDIIRQNCQTIQKIQNMGDFVEWYFFNNGWQARRASVRWQAAIPPPSPSTKVFMRLWRFTPPKLKSLKAPIPMEFFSAPGLTALWLARADRKPTQSLSTLAGSPSERDKNVPWQFPFWDLKKLYSVRHSFAAPLFYFTKLSQNLRQGGIYVKVR